jgi:hypothetical protein
VHKELRMLFAFSDVDCGDCGMQRNAGLRSDDAQIRGANVESRRFERSALTAYTERS